MSNENEAQPNEIEEKNSNSSLNPSQIADTGDVEEIQSSTKFHENDIENLENEEIQDIKRILHEKSSSSNISSVYINDCKYSNSIATLYPPHSCPSQDLLSRYLSSAEDLFDIKQNTSQEGFQREFSKMRITIDDSVDPLEATSSDGSIINVKKHPSGPKIVSKISIAKELSKETKKLYKKCKVRNSKVSDEEDILKLPYLSEILDLPLESEEIFSLCFTETLLISYDCTSKTKEVSERDFECKDNIEYPMIRDLLPKYVSEVGAFCLTIETNSDFNILTFCSSQQSLGGSGGVSKILSVVDENLKLIEEKKNECQIFEDKKIERILHIFRENTKFISLRTESEGGKETNKYRGEVEIDSGDILQDGAIYALMRYLILKKFVGVIQAWTMNISGNICRCIFEVGKLRVIHINNTPYKTIRIKKTLEATPNKISDISKSYFLPTGHLVRHQWKNCPYFLHINPLSRIPPRPYKSVENNWMDDILLASQYLDEKDKNLSEIKTYLGDHPEIKNILKDYILCLLHIQPENIFDYTIDYFLNIFKEN